MHVKIKLTHQLFILLAGLAAAVCAVFLLSYLLKGPKLGIHYDFLLKLKRPQPVSTDILIINTDDIIEKNDKFLVLMALTELGGSNLVITDRVLASSSLLSVNESEIRRRFSDEFFLVGSNIRNLFEAIRLGSVSPVQAPGYVESLVELTEQGRDRLLSALIDIDEDLTRAIAVFGGYIEASEPPKYDKDGKLRRVQIIDSDLFMEHPVYTALKHRYADIKIDNLDNKGSIITPHNSKFRTIDISLFRDYDEALRIMRDVLEYGDSIGAFSQTLPEQSPLFLGDYSLIFREEMLANSNSENRNAWLKSRREYFKSLEDFVNGPAERIIIKNYNDIIEEEGLLNLRTMRDELIQAFSYIRAQYAILHDIRTKLEQEVNASFCIMGTKSNTQYSALLANAIITGSHIKPVPERKVLMWSFIAVLAAVCPFFRLKPFVQLLCGLGVCVASLIVFSCIFIYKSYWADPLISFGAGCLGTLVIFSVIYILSEIKIKQFRTAFGSAVSANVFKELVRNGKPHPGEITESVTAVVAIRDINLLAREDREKLQEAGKLKKMFYADVKEAVFNAGGIIAGFEGDTIIACFGSPLDVKTKSKETFEMPSLKACSFVKSMLSANNIWRFGIDTGKCHFYWSQETGFSVHGRPAVRARILASRAGRLRVRALITDIVREQLDINIEKIDSLYDNSESIYELTV